MSWVVGGPACVKVNRLRPFFFNGERAGVSQIGIVPQRGIGEFSGKIFQQCPRFFNLSKTGDALRDQNPTGLHIFIGRKKSGGLLQSGFSSGEICLREMTANQLLRSL